MIPFKPNQLQQKLLHPNPFAKPSLAYLASFLRHLAFGLWTVWAVLALSVHRPFGSATYPVILALPIIYLYTFRRSATTQTLLLSAMLSITTFWLYTQKPSNDRPWQDEVKAQIQFHQIGDQVTVKNVRNFEWISKTNYVPRWEVRRYDLSQIKSLDLIVSIWDNDNIAHTLLSFGFDDGQQIAVSFEIRKEIGESFSSIGGFFRQYEMTIIAADEKDIIYTRSNVRDERVYLYRLSLPRSQIRKLFLAYLYAAETLAVHPSWYNTLLDNCTTAIFDLLNPIHTVPNDYRILLSGRLPEYLYEIGIIDTDLSFNELKALAFINPKVEQYNHHNPISSAEFSQKIRENLPDSHIKSNKQVK